MKKMNYKIVELAYKVKKHLPASKITINKENIDNRSYKVDFSMYKKLFWLFKNEKYKLLYKKFNKNFKNKKF